MQTNKQSLKMFDGHEDLQGKVTNDAFLFAQVMMQQAKIERTDRTTLIKEGTVGRQCESKGGRRRS